MKKMVVLSIATLVVGVCFLNTFSTWETMTGNEIKGGVCYGEFTKNCAGQSVGCSAYTCTSTNGGVTWTCNVNQLTMKAGGTYVSSCPTVEEDGWTTCSKSPTKYLCSEICQCTTGCSQSSTSGIWYCIGYTGTPTPVKKEHYVHNANDPGC
jgi:hypothetical protein